MNQKTLFDAGPSVPKRARDTDPDTSHQAAAECSKTLGKAQEAMMEVFASLLAYTAQEAAARCVERHGGMAETYRKRVGELEAGKLIENCGSHMCRVTGKRATKYRKVVR